MAREDENPRTTQRRMIMDIPTDWAEWGNTQDLNKHFETLVGADAKGDKLSDGESTATDG